jgi:hypothetical protein
MPEPSSDDLVTIRKALGKLIKEGLVSYHVADVGAPLVSLGIVQARLGRGHRNLSGDERDDAHANALREVLTEAIKHPTMGGKARRLLENVLPLKDELLGASPKERRTEAGKHIKNGKKLIKPGTIRTYYEPDALNKLAEVLVSMEHAHHSTANAEGNPRPDESPES